MNQDNIGKFIKELREEKGWTQDDLAEKMFVDRTLISKWEKGITTLTSVHLKTLSQIFDVSTDEIFVGERINKENQNKINNVKYDLFDYSLLMKKRLKLFLILIVILLILFLGYFFLMFYNSVNIYSVSLFSDKTSITNGIFIKMREYIILNVVIDSKSEIKGMRLYYKNNNEEKIIQENQNSDSFYIIDFADNQDIFDFDNISTIIKNTYLDVIYEDDSKDVLKVDFSKMYSNKKLFVLYKQQNLKNTEKSKYKDFSELEQKQKLLFKKNDVCSKRLKINEIDYDVYLFENNISIDYTYDKNNYNINYTFIENEFLVKQKDNIKLYEYNISLDKCLYNNCDEIQNDYILLESILDKLLDGK